MLDELLGEERVTGCALAQPVDRHGGERPLQALRGELAELIGRQRAEHDLRA